MAKPPSSRSPGPFAEPVETAKAASLRYMTDARPGIRRRKAGSGFSYLAADGSIIREQPTLARIRSLAIPPAWRDVWISPLDEGHLQATGRDVKGRKQYRYHERWRRLRDETKYERMLLFGATLPRIRSRVRKDVALPGLPRNKVLATIVRLLETTFIRVGNEEYARTNRSFGLTTMRDRHVEISGANVRFSFQGKSGKQHIVDVNDRRLARLVKQCRELPGQDLFQSLDEAGEPQAIDSGAVNDYLREISGQDFTAKDFRTWAGTMQAAQGLPDAVVLSSQRAATGGLTSAVQAVAQLGNTPAICRKCYIHPVILAAYQNRDLCKLWKVQSAKAATRRGLRKDESALLGFLRACSGRSLKSLLAESVLLRRRGPARRASRRAPGGGAPR